VGNIWGGPGRKNPNPGPNHTSAIPHVPARRENRLSSARQKKKTFPTFRSPNAKNRVGGTSRAGAGNHSNHAGTNAARGPGPPSRRVFRENAREGHGCGKSCVGRGPGLRIFKRAKTKTAVEKEIGTTDHSRFGKGFGWPILRGRSPQNRWTSVDVASVEEAGAVGKEVLIQAI